MFYDRFALICARRGVTPKQVANELGIKTSTLSMWKTKGVTPNAVTIINLAKYFNTTPAYIMGNDSADISDNQPMNDSFDVTTRGGLTVIEDRSTGKRYLSLADMEKLKRHQGEEYIRLCNEIENILNGNVEVEAVERPTDTEILDAYHCLNELGRREAIKRVQELSEIPKYRETLEEK